MERQAPDNMWRYWTSSGSRAPSSDDWQSDPPPAYSANPHSDTGGSSSSTNTSPAQAALHTSLARLTRQVPRVLDTNRETQASEQSREDHEVVLCMISQVTDLLTDLKSWGGAEPARNPDGTFKLSGWLEAEMYFVPAAVFDGSGWHPTRTEERIKQGVFVREARIQKPHHGIPVSKLGGTSEWAGKLREDEQADSTRNMESGRLWWDEESHARRLAQHLQNAITAQEDLLRVEGEQNVDSDRSSTFGKKKHDNTAAHSVMTETRAEIVAYRRMTEMGLWESQSGWTIILATNVTY